MAKTGVIQPGTLVLLMRWSTLVPALSLLGIGWFFAVSIAGGAVAGVLMDGWLESTPVFTLVGLGIGIIVAFYGGYKLLIGFMSNTAAKKERDA